MPQDENLNIQIVIERIAGLHDDVNDLRESTRDSMREIALAINKLVLVEERQSNANEAFVKLSILMDKMDTRLRKLEEDEQIKRLTSKWVLAGVTASSTAAVIFIAKVVLKTLGVTW